MKWLNRNHLRAELSRYLIGEIDRNDLSVKFLILIRMYILMIIAHRLIQGITFFTYRLWVPAAVSMVFCGLNYLFYRLVNGNNRKTIKYLYTVVALIWIVMAVYLMGWDIGAQHFLFCLMVFWVVTGDEPIRTKLAVGVALCIVRLLLYLYVQDHEAVYALNRNMAVGMQFLNTIFIFANILFLTTAFCRETILTEKEQSHHALQTAYQHAEQANRAKTDFLSSMSHDIRTPLNAIVGVVTLVKRRTRDAAYINEALEQIDSASRQLLALINDILDISKIESGEVQLNEQPFLCPGICSPHYFHYNPHYGGTAP